MKKVFIASPEGQNGRNVVTAGVTAALATAYKTATFRPIVCHKDTFSQHLIDLGSTAQTFEESRVVCPNHAVRDHEGVRGDISRAWESFVPQHEPEAVVITGKDGRPVFDPEFFVQDLQIAADLQAPVFLAICCIPRNAVELRRTIDACIEKTLKTGCSVAGVFVTGLDTENVEKAEQIREEIATLAYPHWVIPAHDCREADDIAPSVALFEQAAPTSEVLAALERADFAKPVTPYAFQAQLLTKAAAKKQTIVLPEGEEDRIIRAADYLLARDIVDLIIVGEKDAILARAAELNLEHLSKARFQSMTDEAILAPMVAKLVELRGHKGMTEEKARKTLTDASYFGTMLVVLGQADGLVSGSVNSTANTVRPALQAIKTKPGQSLVSGAFLMCFEDHVAVFADCAINLNPNAEQLAQIALQSAETARSFGLEPRVGMLSYSTLGSGSGPDVDLVTEATAKVQELDPDLKVVGPIQFDAAWSEDVARTKAKGSDVAGHVNVFVFPSLSAGNIAYKAVQRSSGALAIGPVLQGLNKPVNDLSRGALVEDIINTIALTAVYAQEE
ncbi:phosphate acetyltransferase [Alloscardovia macacae]|uniref:Phosphate acetyltransferase n=1 Tax=Alloscardovia macacae TaxID=1160091 RepID=A0A261F5C6_9BIFI|nr:phosphate acetyltransferase [Alloscardovia macacae]OZG54298.1 phosphate acetyltransferase [Alloscardovia macacae]